MAHTPRRSVLYMPGANPKALEKAKSLDADALIFDLEDSVAPEAKDEARQTVSAALAQGGYGPREIIVRVNALTTPWGEADVAAAAKVAPAALLFPKIDGPEDIERADAAMTAAGAPAQVQLWAMIETPKAILQILEIAAAAQRTRLSTFIMGTNDLAKDMRIAITADRLALIYPLTAAVLAARAHGLDVIDGVFNAIDDPEGFEARCRQGRGLGFDGKTLIHPTQIEPANRIYSPPEAEVARARAVIAAFALPENAGKGVLKVDGKMTELLHLEEAKRLVAVAEAIAARAG